MSVLCLTCIVCSDICIFKMMWRRIYCILHYILLIIMEIYNCEADYMKPIYIPNMIIWNYYPEPQRAYLSPFGRETDKLVIVNIPQKDTFNNEVKENVNNQIKSENLKINGVPKCANGLTYCENIPNYPYRQLEEVLRSNFINRELFENEDPMLSWRRNSDDEQVCKSIQKRIVPMAAINISNEWKYVLNNKYGTGFRQEVQIEVCKPIKKNAANDCGFRTIWGYRTRCKQRYLYRPLLSFSDDGQVSNDIFKLPSACDCTYVLKSIVFKEKRT